MEKILTNGRVRQRGVPRVKDVLSWRSRSGRLPVSSSRTWSVRPPMPRPFVSAQDRRPQLVRVERSLLGRLGKMIAWARSASG